MSKSQTLLDGCLLQTVTEGITQRHWSLASSTMTHQTASETQIQRSGWTWIPTSHISRLPSWSMGDKLSAYISHFTSIFGREKRNWTLPRRFLLNPKFRTIALRLSLGNKDSYSCRKDNWAPQCSPFECAAQNQVVHYEAQVSLCYVFFQKTNLLQIISCNISETVLRIAFEMCTMFHFRFKKQYNKRCGKISLREVVSQITWKAIKQWLQKLFFFQLGTVFIDFWNHRLIMLWVDEVP